MVRAAAKNHASVAIVTCPARYDAVLAALDEHGGIPLGLRSALAVEAFRHTAAYDARIAAELPCRMREAGVDLPPEPGLPGAEDPYPPVLDDLDGEGRDAALRREPPPAGRPLPAHRPRAAGRPRARSRAASRRSRARRCSYNNVLDASAAAALARLLRGPAVVIVKHTNPCGAAERATLLEAWDAALAGDPVSAFGGVVGADRARSTATLAERLTSLFLEVVVAPAFDDGGARGPRRPSPTCASSRTRRWTRRPTAPASTARGLLEVDYLGSVRTAGGAVLVTAPDRLPDDPAAWAQRLDAASRRTAERARPRPRLAARAGASSRTRSCSSGTACSSGSARGRSAASTPAARPSTRRRQFQGADGARGAVAASDAFFPFADGPALLLEAGVTAIVQPGGSMRDAEVLAAVERGGRGDADHRDAATSATDRRAAGRRDGARPASGATIAPR